MQKFIYPFVLDYKPIDYIWGGNKLNKDWNKEGERIAESWELSLNPTHTSSIVNGPLKGKTLADILQQHPEFFGDTIRHGFFPLLVKLIDATSTLSIQVHPDDEFSLKNENQLGKREMWYILEADENASIYLGLKRDVTKEELSESISQGTVEDLLNLIPVKKGDCFLVHEGTLHALRGGTVLLEIQENSAITYRVYDYNRVDKDGKKRELHIEKALMVSKLNKTDIDRNKEFAVSVQGGSVAPLCNDSFFNVKEFSLNGEMNLAATESFITATMIEGEAEFSIMGEATFFRAQKGATLFLPFGGKYSVRGKAKFIAGVAKGEINIL